IIFTASIAIPCFKVVSLIYILVCIRIKSTKNHGLRMKLFEIVHWIGKWSVLDLFVITIMVNLLNRDQLLDFGPGPAALAFGLVVIFTMLAAECFDTKLIWKNVTHNHEHMDVEK
ncbi:MAG: paraquat-inducible protein A, partial [Vibrio sp.]